jgi:hypothetical protein
VDIKTAFNVANRTKVLLPTFCRFQRNILYRELDKRLLDNRIDDLKVISFKNAAGKLNKQNSPVAELPIQMTDPASEQNTRIL